MARKKSSTLTDAELKLMEAVWARGRATVADVVGSLPKNAPLTYSTVLTILRILESKGYLRHTTDGRTFVYEPIVARRKARENAVTHLVKRFFGGSPELLMLSLLESEKIDARELGRLRKRIEESK